MVSHRSVSQLLKYSRCSEDYRLSYVDKVTSWRPAAWLAQGTAFHETVQQYEESGRYPEFDFGLTYELVYDREIESFKAREPDLALWLKAPKTSTQDDIAARRIRGVEQLKNYVQFTVDSPFGIKPIDDFNLGLELPFEVMIGEVLVKGAIDQVLLDFEGVEVRDLKTGNRESAFIQLGVYVLVVEKIFGWPVTKASFYYAKDNKVVTLSRKDLDRYDEGYLSELFSSLEKGIQNKIFIPNPGGHCTLCPVKDNCREMGSNPERMHYE